MPSAHFLTSTARRRTQASGGALLCVLAGGALLVPTGSAQAATGTGSTQASAAVGSTITLSGLTNAFTLTGAPGDTPERLSAVTMNVKTNNILGYAVTVQANNAVMAAATTGNTDSIPSSALQVRKTGTTPYLPLSATAPVPVHTQATRSASAGDTISNDYKMVVPFVNADTYSVTLNYIATTL